MKRISSLLLFTVLVTSLWCNITYYDSIDSTVTKLLFTQRIDDAHHYVDSICAVAENTCDPTFSLLGFYLLGKVHLFTTDFEGALTHYFKALEYLNVHPSIKRKYAVLLNLHIGYVYDEVQDSDKAIEYLEQALQLSRNNEEYAKNEILDVLAASYLAVEDTLNALKCQEELIKNPDETERPIDVARYMFNYKCIQNDNDSIIFYGQELIKKSNNVYLKAQTLDHMADLYLSRKDTLKAIDLLLTALRLYKDVSFYYAVQDLSLRLHGLYLQQHDIQKALYYKAISDSLVATSITVDRVKEITNIERDFKEKDLLKSETAGYKKSIYVILISFLGLIIIGLVYFFNSKRTGIGYMADNNPQSEAQKFQVSDNTFNEIEKKLNLFFDEDMFLDRNCSLSYITEKLDIKNQRYLSEYVKVKYQKSFPRFVNDLRFGYLNQQLKVSKKLQALPLDKIAHDLGFGSKRTFYNLIQEKTGQTPREYFDSITNKNNANS